ERPVADGRAPEPRRSHAVQHAGKCAAGADPPAGARVVIGPHQVFDPAGPAARDIAALGRLLFAVCAVVYALVLVALAWALRRRRRDDDGAAATERRLPRTIPL